LTRDQTARTVALVTALVVAAGLIIQLVSTAGLDSGFFDTKLERTLNVFCFFTILSNLLLGVTNAMLAANPNRRGTLFSALRLSGVVFHIALSKLHDLQGTAAIANTLLHTVTPILAIVSWVVVGPRGVLSRRVVGLTLIYPVAWLVATLIRGAAIDFYPYPFLNATVHGYLHVAINCVIIAALLLALAFGAATLDRFQPPKPQVVNR